MTLSRAGTASLALGLVALSGCTVYPRADEVTPNPTVSFRTVPDAPESPPDPSASGPGLQPETVWTGASGADNVQVAIAGDLVAVADTRDESTAIDVVDSRSGTVRWSTRTAAAPLAAGAKLSATYEKSLLATTVSGRDVILLPFSTGCLGPECDPKGAGTLALDLLTGEVLWRRVLRTRDEAEDPYLYPGLARGFAAGAGVAMVEVPETSPWRLVRGNEVAAIELASGRVRWRASGYARPVIAGGVVVAATLGEPAEGREDAQVTGLSGLDIRTGEQLWTRRVDDLGDPVFVGGGDGLAMYVDDVGAGLLLDGRSGEIVRSLGQGNGDCRSSGPQEVVCLNSVENHLKVIDLADGRQATVPTPGLTRRLYAADATRAFLARDGSSLVVDRTGAFVESEGLPSAAVMAVSGEILVRAADPPEPTSDQQRGPVSIVRIAAP